MKTFYCLIIALAAATIVQAHHWSKILAMADKDRKRRFTYWRHFILSATFIVASAVLGLIATAITNDLLAYSFAGAIGFAPWATVKQILHMAKSAGTSLGPEEDSLLTQKAPASFREFLEI